MFLFACISAAAAAQQTSVADGYHVIHPDQAAAPAATPASPASANPAKKPAAKHRKHLKSVVPGK